MMTTRLLARALFSLVCLTLGPQGAWAEGRDNKPPSLDRAFVPMLPPKALPSLLLNNADNGVIGTLDALIKNGARPTILHLWQRNCPPCLQELPELDRMATTLETANWRVVALSEDFDGALSLPPFFRRYKIKNLTPFFDEGGRAAAHLDIAGLPTTIFLDQNGQETGRVSGPVDWAAPATLAFLGVRPRAQALATPLAHP